LIPSIKKDSEKNKKKLSWVVRQKRRKNNPIIRAQAAIPPTSISFMFITQRLIHTIKG
jgi:hypothetical protein